MSQATNEGCTVAAPFTCANVFTAIQDESVGKIVDAEPAHGESTGNLVEPSTSPSKDCTSKGPCTAKGWSIEHFAPRDIDNDAEEIFKEFAEGPWMTLEGLRNAVKQAKLVVSEYELQDIFEEMDKDGNGNISFDAFTAWWRARPFLGCLEGTASFLESQDLGLVKILAQSMLKGLRERVGYRMDVQTVLRELQPSDLSRAWKDAECTVVSAFTLQLERVQSTEHCAKAANDLNIKFADQTFEAEYKDMPEFLSGVEGSLGLPGKDIYGGIQMEFCYSKDSKDMFTTSNYGGTESTPESEYNFVVNPEMGKEFVGGRFGTPLQVFLYAASAKKSAANRDQVESFDTPLADLKEDVRGAVKAVLLRRVKEAGMTKPFLFEAAHQDKRLAKLAARSHKDLKRLQKAMDKALREAEKEPASGQPSFNQLEAAMEEHGLAREELDSLLETMREDLRKADLSVEEVLALRLYTGPPFMKINGILRDRDVGAKGNLYVCTIFAAISGMMKIAGVSPIPEGRVVYRGQRGMRLPKRFWRGDAQGVKGGVEFAFLSTTSDVEVAVGYATEGALPTVFCIQTGAVDKGAVVGFLSQYPDEAEILMPPRSFLEVVGQPSMLPTNRGPVLSIPVKINCNLQCPSLEKLLQSRKTMLTSTLEHVRKEVGRDVDSIMQSEEARQRAKADIFWEQECSLYGKTFIGGEGFLSSIKQEPSRALAAADALPASWYNTDRNFRLAMVQALDVQRMAMGKLQLWLDDSSLFVRHLAVLSARDCDRKATGLLRRTIEKAKLVADFHGDEDGSEAKLRLHTAAVTLCKHVELIHHDVNEQVHNSCGETMLMLHAAQGHWEAVHLLLTAGADAESVRKDGMTALMMAAQGGLADVARGLVLEGMADPNVRSGAEGRTALMYAAENGHWTTVSTLLTDCSADARIPTVTGATVTIKASYCGHLNVLEVLRREGVMEVDRANNDGYTGLMWAAQNGHEDVVKWLVETGGANVHKTNRNGSTALMMAARNGQVGIVGWLVKSGGADPLAADFDGDTALMLAGENGHQVVVRLLLELGTSTSDAQA